MVGARSPTEYGTLVEQAEGRLPAVDALKVGGIGRDVGDASYVLHKVARSVLVVLLKRVDDLVLEGEEQARQDYDGSGNPAELDAQQHARQHAQGGHHANPSGTAVGKRQGDAQEDDHADDN